MVEVPYTVSKFRESLKAAGARWILEEKLWRVRYRGDRELEKRVVKG